MPPEHGRSHVRAYIYLVLILVVIAGLFYFLQEYFMHGMPDPVSAPAQQSQSMPAAPVPPNFPSSTPPPTSADLVSSVQNFQYLIMYTDSGFEPDSITIKQGGIVRFVNDSSQSAQISVSGGESPVLAHGAYWQQAFNTQGKLEYQANGATGTMTIQ